MTLKTLIEEFEPTEHVLLLDGHNVVFRTIFPASSEVEKSGQDDPTFIYWKTMFLNSVKNVVEKFKPTRFIMTIDDKESWRKKVYAEYKANRKAARDSSTVDFEKFFPVMQTFLDDLQTAFKNLEIIKVSGAEGDDIIAVACEHLKSKITIVSTDKDLYQLQYFKNVTQWNPVDKKYCQVLNAKTTLEIKIIGGDKNDNIPAIFPRCGLKTVEKVMKNDIISKLYDEEYLKDDANRKLLTEQCKIPPEEVLKNYKRNCQLIDFKYIPTEIKENILKELNKEDKPKFDGRSFMNFTIKHRLKSIGERSQEFVNVLGGF